MTDKRISELTLGNQTELDAGAYFPADKDVSTPGTGATRRYSFSQLSEALLARGALANFLATIDTSGTVFKGYYGVNSPTDPALRTGYLWWVGSGAIPNSFPVPASSLKKYNGNGWVNATAAYTPAAFDRWSDTNNGVNYYYSPNLGAWVVDSVVGDGVTISVNSSGKIFIIDAGIAMSKLDSAVQALINGALPRSGGTMSGALSLIAPTANAHAARKGDVDTAIASLTTAINQNIDAVVAALMAAVGAEAAARDTAVGAEAAARSQADTLLQGNIDAEAAARNTAVGAEVAALTAADTAEKQARDAAITAEAAARGQADTQLQSNIDAEAAARNTAVGAEAAARGQADTQLQGAITALGQLLQTEIANEVAALIQAIALKANIHAPHFTGIPETPTPDYSNPLQILNVRSFDELKYIITLFAHDDYMEYSNGDIMIYSNKKDVMSYS